MSAAPERPRRRRDRSQREDPSRILKRTAPITPRSHPVAVGPAHDGVHRKDAGDHGALVTRASVP